MKTISKMVVSVLVVLLVAQPMLAMASSPAQLIPTGKVSVLSEGKEVKQFKAEMPLPQGVMMLCSGSCLVQAQSLQLVARDKAVFGLTEARESWNLIIKSGRVDFAFHPDSKPVAFHTPGDLLQVEKVIVPAGISGVARGYVSVIEQGAQLTMLEGALQVTGSQGSQLVQPGHTIVLAQANLPPAPEAQDKSSDQDKAGGAVGGAGAEGAAVGGAGAEGAAAGGAVAGGTLGGISTTTMVIGGVVGLAAVGGGVAAAKGHGGTTSTPPLASPF